MSKRTAVAILEVMWDWEARTSRAGYQTAPRYYRINPRNHTGSRLYKWIGKRGDYFDGLWVTNACPEVVTSARGRGTPDPDWLTENLETIRRDKGKPDLILVCGRVAQRTYRLSSTVGSRVIELPHPAARGWTRRGLDFAGRLIREGSADLSIEFSENSIKAYTLVPF